MGDRGGNFESRFSVFVCKNCFCFALQSIRRYCSSNCSARVGTTPFRNASLTPVLVARFIRRVQRAYAPRADSTHTRSPFRNGNNDVPLLSSPSHCSSIDSVIVQKIVGSDDARCEMRREEKNGPTEFFVLKNM